MPLLVPQQRRIVEVRAVVLAEDDVADRERARDREAELVAVREVQTARAAGEFRASEDADEGAGQRGQIEEVPYQLDPLPGRHAAQYAVLSAGWVRLGG